MFTKPKTELEQATAKPKTLLCIEEWYRIYDYEYRTNFEFAHLYIHV